MLELFGQNGRLTSQELAKAVDKGSESDVLAQCRQIGLPLEAVGRADGSPLASKLYVLDTRLLWVALDEALQQVNRYALLLNFLDSGSQCQTFRGVGLWIEHVRRIEKARLESESQKSLQ